MSERHVLEVSEARRRRSRERTWSRRAPFSSSHVRNVRRAFWATDALLGRESPGCHEAARLRRAGRVARLLVLLECGARLGDCAAPLGVSERQLRADYQLLRCALDAAGEAGQVARILDEPVADPSPIPDLGLFAAGRLGVELARSRSSGLPDRTPSR